ncbi:MAG: hypothetical protein ACRDPS_09080 [Nocardioides sp.]
MGLKLLLGIALLLVGLGLAAWTTWRHLGRTPRSRSWATGPAAGGAGEVYVLIHQPFGAAFAIELGLAMLVPRDSGAFAFVALLFFPIAVAYVAFMILPTPPFLKPRWYRELRAQAAV